MLEAVILGVNGVLVPTSAFELAGIEVASEVLARSGVRPQSFQAAACRRLHRHGSTSLISRTLKDLGFDLRPCSRRRAELAARRAHPRCDVQPDWPPVLRDLGRRFALAVLDAGCADVLEGLREPLGLAQVRVLWSERLGTSARPPSPLAFRWLARRLDIRPWACLYVAGTPAAWKGAQRAGFRVWPREEPPDRSSSAVAPWELVDWIDNREGTQ